MLERLAPDWRRKGDDLPLTISAAGPAVQGIPAHLQSGLSALTVHIETARAKRRGPCSFWG